MKESLYKVDITSVGFLGTEYLSLPDTTNVGDIDGIVLSFLRKKYPSDKIINSNWKMISWDSIDHEIEEFVIENTKHNKFYCGDHEKLESLEIDKGIIEKLSNEELKTFFTSEEIIDPSNPKILQDYILQGKDDFTMGERINHIEKIAMLVITERFIKGEIK